jgi:hypothetical protein
MKPSEVGISESDDGYAIFFRIGIHRLDFYDIKLSDLATSGGWRGWTTHLKDKTWFDSTVESKLAAIVKTWRERNEAFHGN